MDAMDDGMVTVKSLYQDDLKRFKMPRAGITLGAVRAELVRRHNSTLPENFVVKYEWGKGLSALTTDEQVAEALELLRTAQGAKLSPLRLYLSDVALEFDAVHQSPAGSAGALSHGASDTRIGSPPVTSPQRREEYGAGSQSGYGAGGLSGQDSASQLRSALAPRRAPAPSATANSPFMSKLPDIPSGEEKELVYKIMVVGNAATGKTSIINRFVNNIFSDSYKSTVGADFSRKIIQWDATTTVRLQLWDIAGQDRFAAVTRAFYKNAVGAIVVCDVTRVSTLEAVTLWKKEIDSKVVLNNGKRVPCTLLVNKVDLLSDAEESFRIGASFEKVATECGFDSWFITSAKTNHHITEAIRVLIADIFAAGRSVTFNEEEAAPGTVNLNQQHADDYVEEPTCC